MSSWLAAGLISPVSVFVVIIIVALSTVLLYVAANNVFRQFGLYRLAAGYGAALALLIPVSAFVGSFAWKESLAFFLFFAYLACLALAIVVVPGIFALAAQGRASAPWAILMSAVSAALVAVVGYALRGSGIGDAGGTRSPYDLLYAVILLVIVGVGFSLGARLPWSICLDSDQKR